MYPLFIFNTSSFFFYITKAKRQQRKLNFLITQTELYAHFMSKKLGQSSAAEQLRILNQLDEEKIPRLMHIENYNRYNTISKNDLLCLFF